MTPILARIVETLSTAELEALDDIVHAALSRRLGCSKLLYEERVVARTDRINAIKMVRDRLGLPLMQAKSIVDAEMPIVR